MDAAVHDGITLVQLQGVVGGVEAGVEMAVGLDVGLAVGLDVSRSPSLATPAPLHSAAHLLGYVLPHTGSKFCIQRSAACVVLSTLALVPIDATNDGYRYKCTSECDVHKHKYHE